MNPGDIIQSRYKIKDVLGQGSTGTTYKALDLETHTLVAVKQLHLSRMQQWKTLEMFEREANILQQLHHPRVPNYIDYCSLDTPEGTQCLLIQEFIAGKTLKQLIEEGWHGTEDEILDIFTDLVDILTALHALRPPVIHRDINPKNIIIFPNTQVFPAINDVYLVDFGAVQDRIRTASPVSTTIVGTYGYVPFEQFGGQAVPASDYYALGATLLFMLTHRHPSEFPADDLKPQFEPFLRGSSVMSHLLNGLLEPSVKKRVSSPEAIKEILDDHLVDPAAASPTSFKPETTLIEKIVENPQHLLFRIPRQRIGVVVKHKVLHLTPKWISMQEEILGFRSGEVWRIPAADLQPSDITWYFGQSNGTKTERAVLGINHAGETFEIGEHFSKAEIEWLNQEIHEYLWTLRQHSTLTDLTSDKQGSRNTGTDQQTSTHNSKPPDSRITQQLKKPDHMRFRIPTSLRKDELGDLVLSALVTLAFASVLTMAAFFLVYNNGNIGWIPGGLLLLVSIIFWGTGFGFCLMALTRLFGSTVLHLAPEWTRVSRRCFGIGYSHHIPTAAITQHDVIRFFQKNTLQVGINYAEKTLKLGTGLTIDESEWLIREITAYIESFARPIPGNVPDVEMEMK
ncbi:hypothetical protein CSA56_05175 [candidate division KSB3 bacterium]|uniref:non-specific serine/threonine protein kinase n=1 Tax=candidate division KSB3 bacterium TaxID=2044937 RepID=A0A2G6KHP3_9BACT|nr:MAG: hypothetical protein CSA56_05175 [candidate division KSB3 bacterium]